jgi:dihydrofolate synthase/folylpolyglutamate synthase|tara:strand:+ start:1598 stop:2815 length:1218 start_codon:yes stop_codon:yes gene_type:complete
MNYKETVNWLFNQLPVYQRDGFLKYKLDLSTISSVCNSLENPQKNFKSIHVAGTNGKGSTSHMLASIFIESGYKVGLYTSPHLSDFRERIRINGKMIPQPNVVSFVEKNLVYFQENKISFFEMTVAMAFDYFSNEKVDIAIIETGLGGRLDATNIIDPILSVITNIGLDHQVFLGESIREIAKEKAGIIKRGKPVVISEYQPLIHDIFFDRSKELESDLYLAKDSVLKDYSSDLKGSFQKKNIQGVVKSISVLKEYEISDNNIEKGLLNVVKNTGLRGRWEIINHNPKTIIDVGHNSEAFQLNIEEIKKTSFNKLRIVIGFVEGKDYKKILNLFPKDTFFYLCQPKIKRALSVKEIFSYCENNGLKSKLFMSVKSAYENCKNESNENDLIFICGSNFVISELIEN